MEDRNDALGVLSRLLTSQVAVFSLRGDSPAVRSKRRRKIVRIRTEYRTTPDGIKNKAETRTKKGIREERRKEGRKEGRKGVIENEGGIKNGWAQERGKIIQTEAQVD